MSEWISVDDRLPKPMQKVIVGRSTHGGHVGGAVVYKVRKGKGGTYWGEGMQCYANPTHWMPPPSPPKH